MQYNSYTQSPEGDLTNYRSSVVCTSSIGAEAKRLGYGELLLLSKWRRSNRGREREYILANTFEAVLGALFIDQGIEFCKKFVEEKLLYKVKDIVNSNEYKDSKSKFQEVAQEKFGQTPTYQVLDSGPDHDKTFKIGVFVGKENYGTGEGRSKQKAEQSAAEKRVK